MFAVLITPAIPNHLRGYISRFLTETQPNIFLGTCSERVLTNIWERACSGAESGHLTLIQSSKKVEQGFEIRTFGDDAPRILDLDGLSLIARRRNLQYSEES